MEEEASAVPSLPDTVLICSPSHRHTPDTLTYCAIFTWHSKLHSAMEEEASAVPSLPDTVISASSHTAIPWIPPYTVPSLPDTVNFILPWKKKPLLCHLYLTQSLSAPSHKSSFSQKKAFVMRFSSISPYFFTILINYWDILYTYLLHRRRKFLYRSRNDAFLYTLGLHRRRWMGSFWYYQLIIIQNNHICTMSLCDTQNIYTEEDGWGVFYQFSSRTHNIWIYYAVQILQLRYT